MSPPLHTFYIFVYLLCSQASTTTCRRMPNLYPVLTSLRLRPKCLILNHSFAKGCPTGTSRFLCLNITHPFYVICFSSINLFSCVIIPVHFVIEDRAFRMVIDSLLSHSLCFIIYQDLPFLFSLSSKCLRGCLI